MHAVNESMVEKYGVDSDKDENLSREALSQPPAAADYLRGSIEKVLPQVEDGEEGNFFDVWGLLELFFSYSNDELSDDLIKSETVNDIDVLSDDEDKEDDHVTEDSMKSEESKPFVPSMYSRFLRFAEYMFDSFSDDDDDDECFDDTTANCSNFRHSQTL